MLAFCSRHYAALAVVVLGLAAFNLVFRLGQEIVTQWDESLYAVTAWEMVRSGDWIGTTFLGAVDYYNTKPPLNVWLIALTFWRGDNSLTTLLACWAGMTLLLPTLMTTKLPWYLNPFYPVCALGIAWLLAHGLSQTRTGSRRRAAVLGIVMLVAFVSAESKLIWYSYHYRSLANSVQGLLLSEAAQLAGRRVFSSHWDSADTFVLGGVVKAQRGVAAGPEDFWRQSRPGDYLVSRLAYQDSRLALVQSGGRHGLYRRLK